MTLIPAPPSSSEVPSLGRRQFMNLLTFGAVTGVALGALYPVVRYFISPREAGLSGGALALDELGNPIAASGWLASHPEGDRSLVQGLKGDPTYLIVEGEGAIGAIGLNAICTHLGCVVPWNSGENKFICPCPWPMWRFRANGCCSALGAKAIPAPGSSLGGVEPKVLNRLLASPLRVQARGYG